MLLRPLLQDSRVSAGAADRLHAVLRAECVCPYATSSDLCLCCCLPTDLHFLLLSPTSSPSVAKLADRMEGDTTISVLGVLQAIEQGPVQHAVAMMGEGKTPTWGPIHLSTRLLANTLTALRNSGLVVRAAARRLRVCAARAIFAAAVEGAGARGVRVRWIGKERPWVLWVAAQVVQPAKQQQKHCRPWVFQHNHILPAVTFTSTWLG